MASDLPAPPPAPLGPGDSATINPGPGAEVPPGLRSMPMQRAGGSMPADCIVPAAYVGADNGLQWLASVGAKLSSSDVVGRFPASLQAGALHYVTSQNGRIYGSVIAVNSAGNLIRADVQYGENEDTSGASIATTVLATVGKTRSVAASGDQVFVLTDQTQTQTARLLRFTMNTNGQVGRPIALGKGSWAAVRTISTRSTITTTIKGRTVSADQLRGLDTTGHLVEVRATRGSSPQTTAAVISGAGWGGYRHLVTGVCTKNPKAMPMVAVRVNGSMDLWNDSTATTSTATLTKVGTAAGNSLPPGRVLG